MDKLGLSALFVPLLLKMGWACPRWNKAHVPYQQRTGLVDVRLVFYAVIRWRTWCGKFLVLAGDWFNEGLKMAVSTSGSNAPCDKRATKMREKWRFPNASSDSDDEDVNILSDSDSEAAELFELSSDDSDFEEDIMLVC